MIIIKISKLQFFSCLLALISLVTLLFCIPINASTDKIKPDYYKNMLSTAIGPYVQNAVDNYYKNDDVVIALEDFDYLEVKQPMGEGTFYFIATIQINPFVGAHNTIGTDKVTIKIEYDNIEVIKFEHIKSHKIHDYKVL